MPATIERMYGTHPAPVDGNRDATLACLEATVECSLACTACADACIAESDPGLGTCIRLNLDGADICDVTAKLLSRAGHTDAALLRAQIEACARACKACGDECERHAERMEHCAICAEVCRRCEEACRRMAEAVLP